MIGENYKENAKIIIGLSIKYYDKYYDTAKLLFNMYQSHGLPVEIAIDEMEKKGKIPNDIKAYLISEFLMFKIHNMTISGIGEERLRKMQIQNTRDVIRIYNTGNII
jgi:hypothetical protein